MPAYAGVPLTVEHVRRRPRVVAGARTPSVDWRRSTRGRRHRRRARHARPAPRPALDALVAAGRDAATPVAVTERGTTHRAAHRRDDARRRRGDAWSTRRSRPLLAVVGRRRGACASTLSWFETKPLFGWEVLVPRTKEQAGVDDRPARARTAPAPTVVPTISVEPPRTPQQIERAVKGLVTGRYEWVGFTSVNAVRAIREKFEEFGLDARAFAGLKVAAVGGVTAAGAARLGHRARPGAHRASSPRAACSTSGPTSTTMLDPINRVFLPRADIATDTLVAGLQEMGWEVDDVTAYRTVRAAPPAAPVRDAIKNGSLRRRALHVELDGAQPGRHRRQAAPHRPSSRASARPRPRRPRSTACGSTCSPRADRRGPRRRARRPRRARSRSPRSEAGEAVLRPEPAPSRRPPTGHLSVGGFPTVAARGGCGSSPAMRRLVAETRLHPAELVLPVFVREGIDEPVADRGDARASCSTPSTRSWSRPRRGVEAGLGGIMVFGVPVDKDARGSGADDPDGILNVALARLVHEVGDDLVVMADLCLDEFTDHGHCGVLAADGSVDNDATLERYASMALAQAAAGAHVLGLSGMMDGQVGVRPRGAGCRGLHRHGDPRLRGEVHLRALRPVPRGGAVLARRRPRDLPAGPRQRHRGAARARARHRRGRRHRHGQAGRAAPRRHRGGGGDVAGSRCGVPDLGGVLADRGGRGSAAGSTATG